MAVLNHPREAPPDGWKYFQAETGSWFEAMIGPELVDLIVAHRQWKNLPRADATSAWADLQQQICERMPPGVCTAESGEDYQPFDDKYRSLNSETVLAASKAAIAWLQSDSPAVTAEEAERRAGICRACQYNKNTSCACTPVFKLIDALIPAGRTPAGLALCTLCGCSIRAKILAPRDVIDASNAGRNLRFPAYCWQLPTDGEENGEKVVG